MKRLRKAVERYVEAELYDYPYLTKAIEELRADIAEAGTVTIQTVLGTPIQQGRRADPTQAKGIELATNRRLARMHQTVQAIEAVLGRLRPEVRRLIEMKYFEREYTDQAIARRIPTSTATFYRWQIQVVRDIAIELGLAT